MPSLYIITGSNGAGKSSVGAGFLPLKIQQQYSIFDGDKLYMQKQRTLWSEGIRAHKEAKKIALAFVELTFDTLVENALTTRDNFVYEGHFTNNATWDVPKRFREAGYTVNMLYLGLDNPDLSELRVIDRTKEGGHYVPRNIIEDNFYGNLEKLNIHYNILDTLEIIDTSETNHILLAQLLNNKVVYCLNLNDLPGWFINYLPNITSLIKDSKIDRLIDNPSATSRLNQMQ
ncbi:hypothetical protein DVR12_22815 [Chitinophaga silvatica]|uniref:Zeta toxin domain-containing protein n=1 Tax=Chitinophaga silvatica TaxID=2282649 RepID=A0A3E1Y468_9BACT|nr:zeta toxin family protein [Chitinophaga silvatica]RFS19469.1 hypothetical protein DVR12_22815 [Chitinophaga silvatica]